MPGAFLSAERCDRIRRLCEVHDDLTVCVIAKVGKNTLFHLKRRGFTPATRAVRAIPSDWGIVAPGQTAEWLREHYHASPKTISRWRHEKPVEQPGKGHQLKVAPRDLRTVLSRMTVTQAQEHYGVSNHTLTRWRRQIGIRVRFEPAGPVTSWAERYHVEQQVPA